MTKKILAGIDEAGLGPTLGPLATASFALLCPNTWSPASPWEALCHVFTNSPTNLQPSVVPICDSKLAYPALGLDGLHAILTRFAKYIHNTNTLPIANADPSHPVHPCYTTPIPELPDCTDVLDTPDANPIHLEIRLLHEPAFNAVFETGQNKNELLLAQTAHHIVTLVEKFAPSHPMLIIVDKQGGRNAYLLYLTALFPNAWIHELENGRNQSHYRLRPYSYDVDIVFQAKADRLSFATAAASMAAKYAREIAMSQLNAWFSERLPDLKPTAGYPQDARRWLADVREKHAELLVDLLIRKK